MRIISLNFLCQFQEGDEKNSKIDRGYAWWQKTLIYHIYTPSFYDSDGNGFGDLKGK